ncbi:hypothetical protein [Microbacterium sp. UBA3394]|uniref:hypothetical protein n=1 Tax=Microbacterium sp. UBA3394 TaxID=1946945 RepID=UPI000C62C715|nr:hypothetical protein [Microbacterium sp. UBA3394]MAB81694.1 hypothetical protein [Planctomycetota bacterium]MAM53575.1 hypothetical protein [Microbacterium sp.]
MTDRTCILGCTRRGRHYAACADYSRDDGCQGCVPAEAREGALICHRCYGRLRRTIEQAPEIIAHLRELTHTVSAKRYDSIPGGRDRSTIAPVSAEKLDAIRDIMTTVCLGDLSAYTDSTKARHQVTAGVAAILSAYDDIVNDLDAVTQWWAAVMAHRLPHDEQFWTISRAAARWPIQDRRRYANAPCPECDTKTVTVTPPSHPDSPTWYACTECDWERNDRDNDGQWGRIFHPLDFTVEESQDELELTDAGRRVGLSQPTIRRWLRDGQLTARAEEIERDTGKTYTRRFVRIADVIDVDRTVRRNRGKRTRERT